MDKKYCKKCLIIKPLEEFYFHKSPRDQRTGKCKECILEEGALYQKANPEVCHKKSNKYAAKERARQLKIKNRKLEARNSQMKLKYGITLEDYEILLKAQEGRCAICGIHEDLLTRALAIDHCHTTGKIRGLLCNYCNPGLGSFRDSVKSLQAAIMYLQSHSIVIDS